MAGKLAPLVPLGRWLLQLLALAPLVAQALRTHAMRPCERLRLASTRMEPSTTMMDPLWKFAGLDAVYVAHYTPYTERKAYMERELATLGFHANFITGWDREVLDEADVSCMYPNNSYFERVARERNFAVSWFTVGELGLSMKHHSAYFDAVRRGHRNILVLEDDAVFTPDFKVEMQKILKDIAGDPFHVTGAREKDEHLRDYDIIFLGSYMPSSPSEMSKPGVARDPWNKGAIGYLVSLKGARALMNNLPITGPADHMISNGGSYPNPPAARYARHPYLIYQGSFDSKWRAAIKPKGITNKGRSFIMTGDTHPCSGCSCPTKVHSTSSHVVVDDLHAKPANSSIFTDSTDSFSRMRGGGKERDVSNEDLQLDKEYVDALIEAGRACDMEGVVRFQKSLFEK